MKKKILLSMLALLLAISLVAIGCAAPAPPPAPAPAPTPAPEVEVTKWKMQSSWPGGLLQELADGFAGRVTELSGGRLEIESLTGGSIVGPFEVLEATSAGTLDCYHSWPGYWLGVIPSGPFFGGDAPFPSGPIPWITWMYQGGGSDLMLEAWQA